MDFEEIWHGDASWHSKTRQPIKFENL